MNEQQLINLINRIIDHRLFGFAPGGRLRLDGPNLGQVPATNLPDPLVRDRIFSEVELGAGTGSSSGSAPFLVDDEGDIVAIRNIPYHWPTAQGEEGMGLVNDGAGNLTWSPVASEGGGSSSSCTLMQVNKTVSPDPDGVEDTFTVEGGEYLGGTLMVTVNGHVQSSGSSLDFVELDPASGTFQFMAGSIPQTGDIIRVFYGMATAVINNYYDYSTTCYVGEGGAPTDGEYVVASANGSLSAEIVIPGLAGSPDRKPSAPNTEDDEFDSDTLDVKWTKTSNAANDDVDTTWPSHVYANFTGNQAFNLSQAFAPGGAFSLTICFRAACQANYQGCHIYAYDNDESDGVRCTYEYSNGWHAALGTKDSNIWNYSRSTLNVAVHDKVYLHLQRGSSDDWSCWISFDGLAFHRIGTYTKALTVDHFMVEATMGGSTIPVRTGIDWVRRDWITL